METGIRRESRTGAFLAPARAVMDRLTYPRKFALISVLFALPLALVMYVLVSEINERIDFAARELQGNLYLRPLRTIQEHIGQGRFFANSVNGGATALRPELVRALGAIEEDLVRIERSERELGASLTTRAKHGTLVENWRFLRDGLPTLPPATQVDLLVKLAVDVSELYAHVGNTSNLILDPDLDSYYLMDAVLLKLPAGAGLLVEARILGRAVSMRKAATVEERSELIRLAGLIESHVEQSRSGMSVAFENNPARNLKPRLGDAFQAYDSATSAVVVAMRNQLARYQGLELEPAVYDNLVRAALAANASLWERDIAELDGLLQARIDRFAARKNFVGIFAAILLLMVLYLWMAFYSGVMRTVARLKESSERMLSGSMEEAVGLETRDEMAQVVTSFNNVATRMRMEWAQAQEESARARAAEAQLREHEVELVKAKDAAESANRAKSQFLANMSHELRTPLNAIIGYSEMLEEASRDEGREDFIPDLHKIQAAGRHLLQLINDILDLSKVEAGKMTLFLETFDVPDLLRDVVTTIKPLVQKNANTLEVGAAADLGSMHADVTRVRQCLFNLLSNACKFTHRGLIRLDASREDTPAGEFVRFEVSDTGPGMTPEQLERLFQAFSQADASTTRKYGGTGLGLALTRHFCREMGGDVAVSSEAGKGSRFTMRLPATVRLPEPAPGEPAPSSPAVAAAARAQLPEERAPSHPRNAVLVVDDDPDVLAIMQGHLSREGFEVVLASSGEEALRLARELRPSVITLDVMMPGMDGWAVLAALKADAELAAIPVLMCTILDDRSIGFALGASDFLTKPIDRDRLAAAVRRCSRGGAAQRVLLIEDDAAARDIMARTLRKEGCVVDEAENGRIALEHFARSRPALILLDLMMPEMNGFEFLHELRKAEENRAIPVIVVTAMDLSAEDHRRLHGHVEAVLLKAGHSTGELLREVAQLVGRHLEVENAGKG